MRNAASPVVGYVAAVLAVIATATIATFNLSGMTAKAHRSWDADIDRIIARQQEKKTLIELAALDRSAPANAARDAGRQTASLTTSFADGENVDQPEQAGPQNAQSPNGKRTGKRVTRRGQHFVPAAFVTLPKFAATATSTILRLR